MINCFVKPTVWKSITNAGKHALLGLVCCFVMVAGLLITSDVYAFSKGARVVLQNTGDNGRYVRKNPIVDPEEEPPLIHDGTRGTVSDGPVRDLNFTWYKVKWDTANGELEGWTADVIDGCPSFIDSAQRADQRDAIVEKLFKGISHQATNHDYNDYKCKLSWEGIVPGYIDGHSGWDAQTQSVQGLLSADKPFYSLTDGVVIRAGAGDENPDPYNTIAVYSEDSNGNGMTTLYLHARSTFVYLGQRVKVGSCLGIQGNAGLWPPRDPDDLVKYADNPDSYSEHVHIEVREGEKSRPARGAFESIDPIDYLHDWVGAAEPMLLVEADVNEDDVVSLTDVELVIEHLRENPGQFDRQFDVNSDRVVDIWDAFAIIDVLYNYICELSSSAAPASSAHNLNDGGIIGAGQGTIENAGVSQATVQQWLDLVREIDDGSLVFKHYITMLKSLQGVVVPEKTVLLANYPNPFNPETWIPYYLAKDTEVSVEIYDVTGNLIRQLDIGHQKAGDYTSRNLAAYWDGRCETGEHVVSGVYFYTLTTDDYIATRKMVILK